MKTPDFNEAAMKFVRDHKFSMPVQDVVAAMEIGASMMTAEFTEILKKMNLEMKRERSK